LAANLPSLLVAGVGAVLLARVTLWLVTPYLVYVAWAEARVLWGSCRDCSYFGGRCAFGKGWLAALLLKRGDPRRFARRKVRWVQLLPDFVIYAIPIAAGIVVLSRRSSILVLVLTIVLGIVSLAGTPLVRGSLACRYCKQRAIGCPAERLFSGKRGQTRPVRARQPYR